MILSINGFPTDIRRIPAEKLLEKPLPGDIFLPSYIESYHTVTTKNILDDVFWSDCQGLEFDLQKGGWNTSASVANVIQVCMYNSNRTILAFRRKNPPKPRMNIIFSTALPLP